MAKEGGEQSPAWAPRGSRPVGEVARIPQPCPQGAGHSLLSRRTYCVHPVGYWRQALPGGVWKSEVCAPWGGTEFQPWEALAGPCTALSSWAGQAGAGGQSGELGSSSTRERTPHPSVYFLWSHVQIVG